MNNLLKSIDDVSEIYTLEQPALYALWHTRNFEEWNKSSENYVAVARRALELGEPVFAFDVIGEALEVFSANTKIKTLLGLSLARCGATEKANVVLEELYSAGNKDEETIGILARTHKDLWLNSKDIATQNFHLKRCGELYAEAYQTHKGYWTGINAATFSLLNGNKIQAHIWADEVKAACEIEMKGLNNEQSSQYWLYATLGEACLIKEQLDDAKSYYLKASQVNQKWYGNLASTRRNAGLILSNIGLSSSCLDECLPCPTVVAFTGHMIDSECREQPRFPPDREVAVYASIDNYILTSNISVGYSSAACGSDILFLEAMNKAGREFVIVLPSSPENFIKYSVAMIPNGDWVARFQSLLPRAKQVVILSEQHTGAASYDYANIVLFGLAKSYARQIGAKLRALAIWDGGAGLAGGTGSTVSKWLACGQSIETIDPLTLAVKRLEPPGTLSSQTYSQVPNQEITTVGFSPELVSILFADVVGFSKFSEDQIPAFVNHFMGAIGKLLETNGRAPVIRNTWGDGLYFIFSDARSAGLVGLEICKMISNTDWTQLGFPKNLSIRIGLHSGPVFRYTNPITGQLDFTGTHVSRAARIEPITPPGEVFASEAFAAISEATGITEYSCDYVGKTQMAKSYGVFPTYRVRPS